MSQRDYSQGKIYKLVSKDLSHDLVYIGSTCLDLRKRLAYHKKGWKNWNLWKKEQKKYITSYDLFEMGEVEIVLIETVNATSKAELHAKERYHIENTNCVNKCLPGGKDYWYRDDKDLSRLIREMKNFIENEKVSVEVKKNKKFYCHCGAVVLQSHKPTHLKTMSHQRFISKIEENHN